MLVVLAIGARTFLMFIHSQNKNHSSAMLYIYIHHRNSVVHIFDSSYDSTKWMRQIIREHILPFCVFVIEMRQTIMFDFYFKLRGI